MHMCVCQIEGRTWLDGWTREKVSCKEGGQSERFVKRGNWRSWEVEIIARHDNDLKLPLGQVLH